MATITTTTVVDDLDRKAKADVTVTFSVGGKRYSVDLSKANYAEYVAPLVKAGRSSDGVRTSKRTTSVRKSAPARKTAAKATERKTAFSKLTPTKQRQIRVDLKVPRGRVSDATVAEWKKR